MAPPSLYRTTGSAIGEGSRVKTKADLVPPSVVVRRTDDLKKPVRPHVEDTDFIMTNTIKKETESIMAERVLSAHVLPKRFPVDPDRMIYPPLREENPLYYTTNSTYGTEKPRPHQVADAFFPKSNKFSKSYTDSKPRTCGLNCSKDAEVYVSGGL
mmetsp:Transcript_1305/g.2928  ORF Transcript_1305/g.2928 Transcript_1305/m.2928 type:complete len:156 (-) Transcript_1305:470-937(-)|eukprot:g4417.t1